MLRFLSLAVAILLILGGPASANAPLVLRVGYYEGGPFVDYHASLRAIAEALVERQMIPPVDFPPPSDADSNEAMWAALATASRVGAIRFVESAFWSADWQDDKRMETRRQVMADLSGGSINLMLALGTWAGQDLANDSHSVPTLVISASDPIASGIVESAEDSGRDHIHAEFDPERYIRQIRLFHGIVGFKRIGVALEDSDDGRAWSNLGVLRDAGQDLGFDVATCFTPDSNVSLEQARVGVMRCWSELAPRVDAVWVGVHRGEGPEFMPAILEPLFANKIPTWSQLGIEAVRRGVVFSVARRDHRDLGRYYADVVSQVLAGVKPRQIGQVFVHDKAIVINARTAQIIGRDIPPGLRSAADTVFERIEGRP